MYETQLMKRFDCGDIRPEEWLDVMAFRQIESIHKVMSYFTCVGSMLFTLINDFVRIEYIKHIYRAGVIRRLAQI